MKTYLRKTNSLLNVTYVSGNYTNNLFGENFTIEKNNKENIVGIDLSNNYRVKNKQVNSYADIKELAEDNKDLEFIHIHEKQVIKGIVHEMDQNPNAEWKMLLEIGELGNYSYSVVPEVREGSLFLKVK